MKKNLDPWQEAEENAKLTMIVRVWELIEQIHFRKGNWGNDKITHDALVWLSDGLLHLTCVFTQVEPVYFYKNENPPIVTGGFRYYDLAGHFSTTLSPKAMLNPAFRAPRAIASLACCVSLAYTNTSWCDALSRTERRIAPPFSVILTRRCPLADLMPALIKLGVILVTLEQAFAMSQMSDAAGIKVVWLPVNFPPDRESLDIFLPLNKLYFNDI